MLLKAILWWALISLKKFFMKKGGFEKFEFDLPHYISKQLNSILKK
jgi:hypothetical protein